MLIVVDGTKLQRMLIFKGKLIEELQKNLKTSFNRKQTYIYLLT